MTISGIEVFWYLNLKSLEPPLRDYWSGSCLFYSLLSSFECNLQFWSRHFADILSKCFWKEPFSAYITVLTNMLSVILFIIVIIHPRLVQFVCVFSINELFWFRRFCGNIFRIGFLLPLPQLCILSALYQPSYSAESVLVKKHS